MPCPVCGGRVVKTEDGQRCMNAACASASQSSAEKTVQCSCGESMTYQGLNQLGEPTYQCLACGKTTKL